MFLKILKRLLSRKPVAPQEQPHSQLHSQPHSMESEIGNPNLATIVWRAEYACGHPRIDEQHKVLFLIGNRLIHAARQGHAPEKVERLIGEMSHHILDHFCAEELILVQAGHPMTQEHRNAHQRLQDRAAELGLRYVRGEVTVEDIVAFVAHDVIHGHIIREDLKFATNAVR